jgi:general secretion pathway protein F
MSRYRYTAMDSQGRTAKGELEAADTEQVLRFLRTERLIPIQIAEAAAQKASRRVKWLGKGRDKAVRSADLVGFFQELALLLHAGLPLDRALSAIASQSPHQGLVSLVQRIRDKVRGGSSLAAAMEAQEQVFTRLQIGLIRAGESAGVLEEVLARLAEYSERTQALREQVRAALTYPLILLAVSLISVLALLTYVVPQFQTMFADAEAQLPLATQVVIFLGNGLKQYGWLLVLLGAGLFLLVRRAYAKPRSRLAMDGYLLQAPLLGTLLRQMETARLCRTLGTLVRNGVTLLSALGIAQEGLGNRAMAAGLGPVVSGLKSGSGLAGPLAKAEILPPLAIHMLQVGEESGQLDTMLFRVAELYERETDRSVKRMLSLLEPALILGLGVLIGGIIMSILLAIVSINQLAM